MDLATCYPKTTHSSVSIPKVRCAIKIHEKIDVRHYVTEGFPRDGVFQSAASDPWHKIQDLMS